MYYYQQNDTLTTLFYKTNFTVHVYLYVYCIVFIYMSSVVFT